MISLEDLPPQAEMTQLESLAAGAALLAQGLAFQHGDPNIKAANDLANKIVDVITGQHELRQKAAAMKTVKPGRHRGSDYVKEEFSRGAPKSIDTAVSAQLQSLADDKVSGTLTE